MPAIIGASDEKDRLHITLSQTPFADSEGQEVASLIRADRKSTPAIPGFLDVYAIENGMVSGVFEKKGKYYFQFIKDNGKLKKCAIPCQTLVHGKFGYASRSGKPGLWFIRKGDLLWWNWHEDELVFLRLQEIGKTEKVVSVDIFEGKLALVIEVSPGKYQLHLMNWEQSGSSPSFSFESNSEPICRWKNAKTLLIAVSEGSDPVTIRECSLDGEQGDKHPIPDAYSLLNFQYVAEQIVLSIREKGNSESLHPHASFSEIKGLRVYFLNAE